MKNLNKELEQIERLEKELDVLEKKLNDAHEKYKKDSSFREEYLKLAEEYRVLFNKYMKKEAKRSRQ